MNRICRCCGHEGKLAKGMELCLACSTNSHCSSVPPTEGVDPAIQGTRIKSVGSLANKTFDYPPGRVVPVDPKDPSAGVWFDEVTTEGGVKTYRKCKRQTILQILGKE